jgi:Zn-dependent alcohol dehydrogenase
MNALLFGPVPVKKGMTVLTQGTGGVSCFAIQVRNCSSLVSVKANRLPLQIAAAIGATEIATSSSNAKLDVAKELGAVHTINYVTLVACVYGCIIMELCGSRPSIIDTGLTLMHE